MEFSIDLVDPGYRELLDHRDSPQYTDLAAHLQDQVTTPPPLPPPWPRLRWSVCVVKQLTVPGCQVTPRGSRLPTVLSLSLSPWWRVTVGVARK